MKTTLGAETVSDAQLVEWSLTGDREAFGWIVERYQSLVCSITYGTTGSLSLSEDIAQETFVTAWRQLTSLNDAGKLRAWLCGIARNLVNNALRRGQREPLHAAEPLETIREPASTEPSPSAQAVSREEEAILWRALEQMPDTYREPLILFYREQQSVERVAQELELSEDAVKQRLSRGRKLLTDEVAAFVEGTLRRTTPGKVFTVGVLAALPMVTTSAKAATIGVAVAKGGAAAKSAATVGSAGGLFAPVMGVLGFYITLRSEIENTKSPCERQLMIRMVWIRVTFIILCLALLFFGMRKLDARQHPLAFEIALAAFAFGIAIFSVVMFGYFDRRQRQIEIEGGSSLELEKHKGRLTNSSRTPPKRNVYVAAAAGMAFPLAWLVVVAVRAFRTGLWVTALLTLLIGGMFFFLAIRAWKHRPQYFIKFEFSKVVTIVALCGLFTLLQYNLGKYIRGIVAIASGAPVVTSLWVVVAFNVVVVLVYAAFIGILVWKRKSELRSRSLK
jgi:RNA polymerase sigma factor (sigma-70 family)